MAASCRTVQLLMMALLISESLATFGQHVCVPCTNQCCRGTFSCPEDTGPAFQGGANPKICSGKADAVVAIQYNNESSCNYTVDYRTSSAMPTSFGDCATVTACITGTNYMSQAPTYTTDRVCLPVEICNTTEYQTAAPTLTTDRVCLPVEICNTTEYQTTAPTLTTDRGCGQYLDGLSAAVLKAQLFALNVDPVNAIAILADILSAAAPSDSRANEWPPELTALYDLVGAFLINLQSGFDATGFKTYTVDTALSWNAAGGPKAILQDQVTLITSYETAIDNLNLQQAFAEDIAAAVANIESNIDSRLAGLAKMVEQNAATLHHMEQTQNDILKQVQSNGQMLQKIASDQAPQWLTDAKDIFSAISSVVSIGNHFLGDERRARRVDNLGVATNGLPSLRELDTAASAFGQRFGSLGNGWDVDGNGLADDSEVAQLCTDVGASLELTQIISSATFGENLTWPAALSARVAWLNNSTIGQCAAVQLQGSSQPLRTSLQRAMVLWGGGVVGARSTTWLADQPTANATQCYGVSITALISGRKRCATNFPTDCTSSTGFGLWDKTLSATSQDVVCAGESKSVADAISATNATALAAFDSVHSTISKAMLACITWMQVKAPSANITSVSEDPRFATTMGDLRAIVEINTNTRALFNGSLTLGGTFPTRPYNLTNIVVDQRIAAAFLDLVNESAAVGQYFNGAHVFSNSLGSMQQTAMMSQLADINTFILQNMSQPKPSCLPELGKSTAQACNETELDAAVGYITQAKAAVVHQAIETLSTARQAILYQTLDVDSIQAGPMWPDISGASDVQRAVSVLDQIWARVQNQLGGNGDQEHIELEIREADFPNEFASLRETGIFSFQASWPANPRQRRAKLLNADARPYFAGAQKDVHVTTSLSAGKYSVFFPLSHEGQTGDVDWLQLFDPSLSNFNSEFSYQQSNCATLSGACNNQNCPPDDFLLQSPYGEWVLSASASNPKGEAIPPTQAFGGVTAVRIIFQVWYYGAPNGTDDLFYNNTCGGSCVLAVSDGPSAICSDSAAVPKPTRHVGANTAAIAGGVGGGCAIILITLIVVFRRRIASAFAREDSSQLLGESELGSKYRYE